ncbi:MAG: glycine dehydrogenase subunit 2 [Bradymonadales bacterium]|nr:MAG: glycine dehydrogenase subunit 2 [Bradymonadales bacterium]
MKRFGPTVKPILSHEEALIFEKSKPGRLGYSLPPLDVPEVQPQDLGVASEQVRTDGALFPEASENELVRHFTRLSQKNCAIDLELYPLGSCTMKYNPKINEELASSFGFGDLHPFWPLNRLQPALAIQYQIQELLKILTGLGAVSLQPSAGAHGEYVGIKVMRAYHRSKGQDEKKTKVLIPESAHGTNPATCSMVGYEIVSIPTNEKGIVELQDVFDLIDDSTAGIMMTNPNTLGLFETQLPQIAKRLHEVDGLFYMDGANFNALLGISFPGDLGVDLMHINLHKTFSTPHGGGGPGAGAVAVRQDLEKFLPSPLVGKTDSEYFWKENEASIGRVGGYFGNFSIQVRALAYLLSIGNDPKTKSPIFRRISEAAVLNANYIRARLKDYYRIPFDTICMHEVLLSDELQKSQKLSTQDIAKRLMDYGYHPMTVYFPLVVSGAMLIEPTESESKESIDRFCEAMISIARECQENPKLVSTAPHSCFRTRPDELLAQKKPKLRWLSEESLH